MKKILLTSSLTVLTIMLFAQWQRIDINTEISSNTTAFKLIDDSTFAYLDESQKAVIGSITTTGDYNSSITLNKFDITLPNAEVIDQFFFLDEDNAWFTTLENEEYKLYSTNNYATINEVAIPDSILPNISGVKVWSNGKGIMTFNETNYDQDDNFIYTTTDNGTTWQRSSIEINVRHQRLKTYPDGNAFIYDEFYGFAHSTDYGITWKTYLATEFTDVTIRNYIPEERIFNEPFINDGELYVVGDYGFYSTHANIIYQLDPNLITIEALNANEKYESHGIFFSKDEFFFDVNNYGNEDKYSGPTVYRDSSYFPVFKTGNIDYTRSNGTFDLRNVSYSNDNKSLAYLFGNTLVRYNPEMCAIIELDIRNTPEEGYNLSVDINSSDFISYTGWAVYSDSTKLSYQSSLDTLLYSQTYGSFPGNSSMSLEQTNFDPSLYYSLIFDYELDRNSCQFDYYPNKIITANKPTTPSINIYPNPTSDVVYISQNSEYILYTLEGIVIKKGKGSYVDLSTEKEGYYIIEIDGKKYKVIKQ